MTLQNIVSRSSGGSRSVSIDCQWLALFSFYCIFRGSLTPAPPKVNNDWLGNCQFMSHYTRGFPGVSSANTYISGRSNSALDFITQAEEHQAIQQSKYVMSFASSKVFLLDLPIWLSHSSVFRLDNRYNFRRHQHYHEHHCVTACVLYSSLYGPRKKLVLYSNFSVLLLLWFPLYRLQIYHGTSALSSLADPFMLYYTSLLSSVVIHHGLPHQKIAPAPPQHFENGLFHRHEHTYLIPPQSPRALHNVSRGVMRLVA